MSEHEFDVGNPKRRKTPPAQHRMDDLFRALIENSLDVITIIDADGVIRYASPPLNGCWDTSRQN